jgi:O-antigen/teichoic acid export membrane protein
MSDGTSGRLGSFLQGSAVLFVGFVIQLGVGFAARLLIARYLGQVSYGLVNIGLTVMTTASVVVLLGLDTGIGRYLPRQENSGDRRGVLVSSFSLVLPVAALAGGAIAVFAGVLATAIFNDPSAEPVIRLFGITIPLMVVVKLTIGSIRGHQEATPRVLLQNLGLPLTRFGLIAVAIVLGFGAVGVAGAYTGAYLLVGAGGLYYLYRRTSLFERTAEATPMRRELLTFSAPLMIVSTMAIVHSNIDVFILGYFQSTGEVGIYTAVYPLANLLRVGLSTFGFLFMPLISELHANGRGAETQRTYQIVSKWVLLATLPVLLVFVTYPEIVIQYTFGSEYTAGATALAILAIGFFTHAVSGPSGDTLTAIGKTRLVMVDNIMVAATNVGLNLLLVPRYSLLGAAVATTVAYAVMNSLYVAQLYRSIGVHPFRRAALAPAVGAVVVWFVLNWVVDTAVNVTLPVFLALVAMFGIVYLGLVLTLGGVESEEVDLVTSAEDRLEVDLSYLRVAVEKFSN